MPDFTDYNRRRPPVTPKKKPSLRLLLGDPHRLLLEMMVSSLEPEFAVAGTATDGPALLAAARSLRPDIVLLDVAMPRMTGMDIARHLWADGAATRSILLGTKSNGTVVAEAFSSGAAGYLLRAGSLSEVRDAIWAVAGGGHFLTPSIAGGDIRGLDRTGAARPSSLPSLTLAVVRLLIGGLSIRTIALQLGLAPCAVERHQRQAMTLLGARDDRELIVLALGDGWLDGPMADPPGPEAVGSRDFDRIADRYRHRAADTDQPELQDAYMQLAEGYEQLAVWQDVVLAAGDLTHDLEAASDTNSPYV